MKYTGYYIYYHYYHYVLKCKKEKCIWKIFVKYTQIRLSNTNTNTNTNISSCGFSNTNTNTNTNICVFKYKYKYKYVFDPSPACGYPSQRASCVENVPCNYVIIFDSIDKNYNYCKIYLWVPSHLLVGRDRTGTNLFFTVRNLPIFTSVKSIVLEIRLRRKNTTLQRSNFMRCGYSCTSQ